MMKCSSLIRQLISRKRAQRTQREEKQDALQTHPFGEGVCLRKLLCLCDLCVLLRLKCFFQVHRMCRGCTGDCLVTRRQTAFAPIGTHWWNSPRRGFRPSGLGLVGNGGKSSLNERGDLEGMGKDLLCQRPGRTQDNSSAEKGLTNTKNSPVSGQVPPAALALQIIGPRGPPARRGCPNQSQRPPRGTGAAADTNPR